MRHRNRNEDAYLDEDELQDRVVPPGGSVRVPLQLCDGVQRQIAFDANNHRPHYATPLNDAAQHDKAAARLQYISDLQSAWASPARRSTMDTTPALDARHHLSTADAQSLRNAAYDAYVRNLSTAYKSRPQDQAEPDDPDADDPDNDPDAANIVERQRREVTAEDLERQRRKIHADFSRRLSEAWRGGK